MIEAVTSPPALLLMFLQLKALKESFMGLRLPRAQATGSQGSQWQDYLAQGLEKSPPSCEDGAVQFTEHKSHSGGFQQERFSHPVDLTRLVIKTIYK
jgi:hypothetical protein